MPGIFNALGTACELSRISPIAAWECSTSEANAISGCRDLITTRQTKTIIFLMERIEIYPFDKLNTGNILKSNKNN